MSTPPLTPPTQRISQTQSKSTEMTPSTPSPPTEANHYTCTCGHPDSSDTWICCDNLDCPIQWYHWECVDITRASLPEEWFCQTCRASSPSKTTPTTPTKPPTTPRSAKKGIAVKKATPKKKGWMGWVEVSSESEGEEGKKVNENAEAAAIRARTRESMIRATKPRGRVQKSQTSLEAGKPKPDEAGSEPEKRTRSHGGGFKGDDGTEPFAKANDHNDNNDSNSKELELSVEDSLPRWRGPPKRAPISGISINPPFHR